MLLWPLPVRVIYNLLCICSWLTWLFNNMNTVLYTHLHNTHLVNFRSCFVLINFQGKRVLSSTVVVIHAIGQICRFSLFQTQENGNGISEAPVAGWALWLILPGELWAEVTYVTSGLNIELLVWDLPELSFSSGMVVDNIWYMTAFSA